VELVPTTVTTADHNPLTTAAFGVMLAVASGRKTGSRVKQRSESLPAPKTIQI